MKLRNKKTGEIRDFIINKDKIQTASAIDCWEYNSLVELIEEWEDYEEPKEYYCIDWTEPSGIYQNKDEDLFDDFNKEIGNYFSSREEAEKAVEKLKAWVRLKDKGFKFDGWTSDYGKLKAWFKFDKEVWLPETEPDLVLLFGGEE